MSQFLVGFDEDPVHVFQAKQLISASTFALDDQEIEYTGEFR